MSDQTGQHTPPRAPGPEKTPKETVDELKVMLVDYAKQETLGPLKALGKWVAFGMAGAILIFIGLVLWTLALLRVLQAEVFDEGWTWVPYLITLGAVVVLTAAFAALAAKGTSEDGNR